MSFDVMYAMHTCVYIHTYIHTRVGADAAPAAAAAAAAPGAGGPGGGHLEHMYRLLLSFI